MPYLKRPGGTIFFDDTGGNGCPVITTHGYIENGSYWAITGVTDALVDNGYRVINTDLRGHGRSIPSAVDPDYSIESTVDDISAIADSLGLDKFHLLTHATGGITGTRFAITHHDRLRSLISTSCASATMLVPEYAKPEWDGKEVPALDGSSSINKPNAMGDLLRSGTTFNQITDELQADRRSHMLGAFFKGFDTNADPERCWRLAEQIYGANNPLLCADFADDFYLDPDPKTKGLQQVSCPSMVLVGEYDYVMVPFCEQIARNIPGSEYVVLDKVGHMTAIEDPERTSASILDFLSCN